MIFDEETKQKLAKIAGLLFSDTDGEALAAARAIRRTIELAGGSVHDFTTLICHGREAEENSITTAKMADDMLENVSMMKSHEKTFVKQMKVAAAQPGFFMTPRQASWFAYLYTKYGP